MRAGCAGIGVVPAAVAGAFDQRDGVAVWQEREDEVQGNGVDGVV